MNENINKQWEIFLEANYNRAFRYLKKIIPSSLRSFIDADDIIEETVITFLKYNYELKYFYFMSVAKCRLIDHIRRNKRANEIEWPKEVNEASYKDHCSEQMIVDEYIRDLPIGDQKILLLLMDNCCGREIALKMKIDQNKVKRFVKTYKSKLIKNCVKGIDYEEIPNLSRKQISLLFS